MLLMILTVVLVLFNRRLSISAKDTPQIGAALALQEETVEKEEAREEAAYAATAKEDTRPERESVRTTASEERDHVVLGAEREEHVEETLPDVTHLIDFDAALPYAIDVNRAANTVTVYGVDFEGDYSVPYKAFVCSAGETTITGTFYTSRGQSWGTLYGGVYAQYSTRIYGPFLFHSVPYLRYGDPSSLIEGEYNKLGTLASMGCIRLSVADAKWIFDNCPPGTQVRIYDDPRNPGPLGKPEPVRIDEEDARRGWDPTDPDENNPWTHEITEPEKEGVKN